MRLESSDAAVEPFPAKERADLMNVRNLSASKRISQPSEVLVNVPVIDRYFMTFPYWRVTVLASSFICHVDAENSAGKGFVLIESEVDGTRLHADFLEIPVYFVLNAGGDSCTCDIGNGSLTAQRYGCASVAP